MLNVINALQVDEVGTYDLLGIFVPEISKLWLPLNTLLNDESNNLTSADIGWVSLHPFDSAIVKVSTLVFTRLKY